MQEIRQDRNDKEFTERVVAIDRVARVVKGGRRFRFRAAVVIGDGKGQVGMGIAKAADVTGAVSKATLQAKKSLVELPLYRHGTIGYEVTAMHRGAKVLLKPAGPGTGVIAGGAVRDALEVAGVSDVLAKSLGSSNKLNTVYATLNGFKQLKMYHDRYQDDAAASRRDSNAKAKADKTAEAAKERS